jgi:hypothetical protein
LLEQVFGPLAQLVEQLTLNQLVVGSIPTRPTISARIVKSLRGSHASIKSVLRHWTPFVP